MIKKVLHRQRGGDFSRPYPLYSLFAEPLCAGPLDGSSETFQVQARPLPALKLVQQSLRASITTILSVSTPSSPSPLAHAVSMQLS